MNFINVSELNSMIENNPEKLVSDAELLYKSRILDVAEKIKQVHSEKPMVLLSGPSGSGKTTTALRIKKLLCDSGYDTCTLSMDNYFLPKDAENMPIDENGNVDLESPLRLDIELFQKHLKKISDGEYVEIPVFDFPTQTRSDIIPFKREKHQTIIIEGIHALNPLVTGDSDSFSTCVYVSVRTRIKTYDGSLIHPRKIRLMRRLCRDKLFRGRKLSEVFDMLESVSRGEDLYIMPFKNRSSFDIDTFISYEAAVYKNFLLNELKNDYSNLSDRDDYNQILKLFAELDPLDPEKVDNTSLVREFIGGSTLTY